MLVGALTAHDGSRDRSKQKRIGPSGAGSCKRYLWHTLQGTPKLNETDMLAAIMGTYIHKGISEAIKREDPFGDNFLIEQQFSTDRITGNIDLFIKDRGLVIDWKTIKVNGLRYFPSLKQRYQIHIYGYILEYNGFTVNEVALVAICRDGGSDKIKEFREPYSREIAEQGLAWIEEVEKIVAEGLPAPEPTEKLSWCSNYCAFYDPSGEIGCPSTNK
jgi:hypothetical protein